MKSEHKSRTATRRVVERKAHRAGPVEAEHGGQLDERFVQRCLRCDILLRIIAPEREPLKPGARVFAADVCPGSIDRPMMLQYEDD